MPFVLAGILGIDQYFFYAPPELGIRPVNDAHASTYGQTGRKEATDWGELRGHPASRRWAFAGALEPPSNTLINVAGDDQKVSMNQYEQ